jgi:internalin A
MAGQPDRTEQAEPTTAPRSKRRRRFELSLRLLMLLVLLIGGGMGWVAYQARVQREAVTAIEAAGGTVFYDLEWKYGDAGPEPRKPRWPKWLVKLVGPDYVGNVMAVQFLYGPSNKADDEVMARIARLGHLEDLDYGGPDYGPRLSKVENLVTSAGIARLRGLTRLRRLRLCDVSDQQTSTLSELATLEELLIDSERLTDAGLVNLAPLKQIKRLELRAERLTATGLDQLIGFNRLESLKLWLAGVNDFRFLSHFTELNKLTLIISVTESPLLLFERKRSPRGDFGLGSLCTLSRMRELTVFGHPYPDGLLAHIGTLEGLEKLKFWQRDAPQADYRQIARLSHLKHLSLMSSGINDESLIHLSDLKGLESLGLPINPITDAGLSHLSGLTQLENLELDHTKITDAGLIHLIPLKKCKNLTVRSTGVTVDGLSDLRAKQQAP